MAIVPDIALLGLVQSGDQQALVALYDRYSSLVYSVSYHRLKDANSAEDVVQEVFMQLWCRPSQVAVTGETLHGWFFVASRNRSISLLRKRCSESFDDSILVSPCNLEMDSERRLMCEQLVSCLDCEHRLLLEMAFLREMSHTEIASSTGYPLGTIKSRIRSAVKKVRKSLTSRPEAPTHSESASSADPIVPLQDTIKITA